MKRKYIYILFAAVMTMFSGCGKWLDISPEDEISKGDMYKTPEGFQNVLNGVYLSLGEQELYGRNLTWGAMEAWSQAYSLKEDVDNHEAFISLENLAYEDREVVSFREAIWLNLYKNIARVNDFLQEIADRPDDFFRHGTVDKQLMVGEAHALRAYLHFDLLRIYAQTPAIEGEMDKAYIPYVETYPSKVNPPMKTSEVLAKIIADLEIAAANVAVYDTDPDNKTFVTSYDYRFGENEAEWGRFYSKRGVRLNYYAIRLLQARVALYAGDYESAKTFSSELVDMVKNGDFKMEDAKSIADNPKLMKEVLFAFYDNELILHTQDWFNVTNTYVLKSDISLDFSTINKTDQRKGFLSGQVLSVYSEDKNGSSQNYLPGLRLGEAYYILAEAMAHSGQLAEAIELFNSFIKLRWPEQPVLIQQDASVDDFDEYLANDARIEFAGMGQSVFFYKRKNMPVHIFMGKDEKTKGKLVFPVPDTESAI